MDGSTSRAGCVVVALFLGGLVGLAGCSAGTSESGRPEGPGSGRAAQALHDDCAGAVECTDASGVARNTRQRRGDTCIVGHLALERDGSVDGNPAARWSGDASAFAICVGTQCLTCAVTTSAAGAGAGEDGVDEKPHERACKGSPSPCSAGSPGSCADVRGCRMASHLRANGTFENSCEGSADGCASMESAAVCRRQGCTWK